MPGRSSKKVDIVVLEAESTETTVTNKKGRKGVAIETTEVVTKIEQAWPAKSKEARKGKADVQSDDESLKTPKKPSAAPKINSVKSKTVLDPKQKKTPAKRKAKAEEDDNDEENTENKKTPKKRKTKEEKEAEAMPLATRTLIGGLTKAMHIGAHVSGAGGESPCSFRRHVGTEQLFTWLWI